MFSSERQPLQADNERQERDLPDQVNNHLDEIVNQDSTALQRLRRPAAGGGPAFSPFPVATRGAN